MFTTSMGPTWDNLTERVAGELLGNAPKCAKRHARQFR